VPSVRGVSTACATTLPLAVLLTGCVSTQTVAARVRLVDARIIASQTGTEVTRANPAVSAGTPVVIRNRTGSAIVVALRNDSARALTDLPISVGVRMRSGREFYLNRSANLDYFASHVAAIGPHAATAWVFTTGTSIPSGRPFANVGFSQLHPTPTGSLPPVEVSLRAASGGVSLELSVVNRSAIPQYDLPVYAIALRAGREVAAGRTAVAHLGTRATTTSTLSLLGSSHYDALRLIASPTIFN
jgi:hypothetical protein